METTAAWGGQHELTALAAVLKRPIKVFSVGLDLQTLGSECVEQQEPLVVCYLRHAFGLGEHYNSVKQQLIVPGSDNDDEDDVEDQTQQQQQPEGEALEQ